MSVRIRALTLVGMIFAVDRGRHRAVRRTWPGSRKVHRRPVDRPGVSAARYRLIKWGTIGDVTPG